MDHLGPILGRPPQWSPNGHIHPILQANNPFYTDFELVLPQKWQFRSGQNMTKMDPAPALSSYLSPHWTNLGKVGL